MRDKPVRIWVSNDFARFIKVESAKKGKSIFDFSNELIGKEVVEKKKDEKYKFNF